jgi:hypothetical protein
LRHVVQAGGQRRLQGCHDRMVAEFRVVAAQLENAHFLIVKRIERLFATPLR